MHTFRTLTLVTTATALMSMGLVAPAHAAPTFSASDSDGTSSYSNGSINSCTFSSITATPPVNDLPIVENGPVTTSTQTQSGRVTLDSDNTDFIDFASTITTKMKITSAGGNPKTISLDAAGNVAATASKPVSGCKPSFYSYIDLEGTFSVTDPGFLLYDVDASRYNYAEINISDEDDNEIDIWNEQRRWRSTGRHLVDPGIYEVFMEGDAWVYQTDVTVPSTPVNVNLHLTYYKIGAVLAKAKGKAKKYAKYPKARSCSSHDLELKTKSSATKTSLIKVLLNGKTVKSLKNPKAGSKIKVKVADSADAVVTVQAVVKPTRRGAKPETVESTATYLACA